jgi:hypothetical protein
MDPATRDDKNVIEPASDVEPVDGVIFRETDLNRSAGGKICRKFISCWPHCSLRPGKANCL